jgi:iron(III) transport system permease protein
MHIANRKAEEVDREFISNRYRIRCGRLGSCCNLSGRNHSLSTLHGGWFPESQRRREGDATARIAGVILNTVIVVAVSALLATVGGTLFAWLNERTDARMGVLTDILPVVPLLVPPIAGAVGWIILASPRSGYLNIYLREAFSWVGIHLTEGPLQIASWYGLILVYTLYMIPHVYVVVSSSLRNLDPALEEAAYIGGARLRTTVRQIVFPAIRPSVIAGGLLAAVIGFALFSVPAIIGTQAGIEVLSVRIVRLVTTVYPPETDVAIALGGVVVVVLVGLWWWQRRVTAKGAFSTIGGRSSSSSRTELGRLRLPARILMAAYLFIATVLPFLALGILALQPYWSNPILFDRLSLGAFSSVLFERGNTRAALENSLMFGALAATLAICVSILIAMRLRWPHGRKLTLIADGAGKLPGALSNVVVAVGILAAFAGPPFALHGTAAILILGYCILYMPQGSVSTQAAITQVGQDMTDAALMSGASSWRALRKITVPLAASGLIGGWVLVFVLAAGDITASAILAGVRTPVVGYVILELWQNGSYPTLAAFGATISVLSTVVVGIALWIGRHYGAGEGRTLLRRSSKPVDTSDLEVH